MNKKSARRILTVLVASVFLLACNCNTIQSLIATPTPTMTATPLPTPTPLPTNTLPPPPAASDFSGTVLTLADLPSGFDEIPAETMGLDSAEYLSSFAFMNINTFETVFGYNMLYESSSDLAVFTLAIENPDLMKETLAEAMGLSADDMETFDVTGIGESASGIAAATDMEGLTMQWEIVMFLRGNTGNTMILMYLSGQPPSVSVVDLARIWDRRLAEVSR